MFGRRRAGIEIPAVGSVEIILGKRDYSVGENRPTYIWMIKDAEGATLGFGHDLRGPNGQTADAREGLKSLLSFLREAGEAYQSGMRGRPSENADLFPSAVAEWSYLNSTELEIAAFELDPGGLEQ